MPKSLTENNVVNLAAISRVVTTDNGDEDGDDDDKTLQAEAQEIARITIKWDTLSGSGGGRTEAGGGPCRIIVRATVAPLKALSCAKLKANNEQSFL